MDKEDIQKQLEEHIFKENITRAEYFPSFGFTHTDLFTWRDINHHHAHVFFRVLDEAGVDYYVFAGTTVGYVRNTRSIPWVDDYDILVMETEISKIEGAVCTALAACGFRTLPMWKGGIHVLAVLGARYFQCDIFYSRVDKDGCVRNIDGRGRYTYKNVPWSLVAPAQRITIDGDLTVPVFADYARDVQIEYGDVFSECVFHISHKVGFVVNAHFSQVYDAFESLKADVVARTRARIERHVILTNDANDVNDAHVTLPSPCPFDGPGDFLAHVRASRAGTVWFFDPAYLKFCLDIELYLPRVRMHFCMLEPVPPAYICFVQFAKCITYVNTQHVDVLLEGAAPVFARRRPTFVPARAITFGTFDLFHTGHHNVIARARAHGTSLAVGVSSDTLNACKGKTSVRTIDERIADVRATGHADDIFVEESLEEKNTYITSRGATVLVMGDDWIGKFDNVPCACVYVPRTPGVSTTLLKQQMQNESH